MTIHQQMGELEMKNTILREFSHIPSFTNFVFLECEANNIFKQSAHELTGGIAVEKRGTLYLCEKRNQSMQLFVLRYRLFLALHV